MREREIQTQIQLALAKLGLTLFRNNTGTAWSGDVIGAAAARQVQIRPGDILIRNARPLHAGLHVGSPDLCGWLSVVIGPEHVGRKLAIFTGVECKSARGRVSEAQRNFLTRLTEDGGIAVVARSEADAVEGLNGWIRK